MHHVATVYPIQVDMARQLASGTPIAGVSWDAVAEMNAEHSRAHAGVGRQEALDLLRRNSKEAADRVRAFADEELDTAAPLSLNADAPLTAQFYIEMHAIGHSFHHLARMRSALDR